MRKPQIRQFRHLARQFQRLTGALLQGERCCGGLTLAQCHLLLEIGEREGVTLVELARTLGLDKSTLSRTVDGLVDRELVERKPSPEDRRYNLHVATPQGEEVLAEIHRTSDECVRETFRRIPAAERERVLESLQILVQAMSSPGDCCGTKPVEKGDGT